MFELRRIESVKNSGIATWRSVTYAAAKDRDRYRPVKIVTPEIPACRQSFMEVYRVKTRQKGRVAKREEGGKGSKR